MGLNPVIPVCMILELVLICIKNTSKSWDHYPLGTFIGIVDGIYTLLVPVYLFSSVLWVFYFKSHFCFITKVRMIRMYQGGILSLLGAAMLWTAVDVGKIKTGCYGRNSAECEGFELRTTAGVLAIIDACLYCLRPVSKSLDDEICPIVDNNSEVYVVPNELPEYEDPPSYYDLQLQLNGIQVQSPQSTTNNIKQTIPDII